MKVLVQEGLGIWLAARRLHKGKFFRPGSRNCSQIELSAEQLHALVLGYLWQNRLAWQRHFRRITSAMTVVVVMAVTCNPPSTDPYVRSYRIQLLPWILTSKRAMR
ncbi:transposase [Pseudomonas sp. ANT_J12]|nr:transposase [Pseudomonas sp. ANT_J12]